MSILDPTEFKMALRFRKQDAPILQAWMDRVTSGDLPRGIEFDLSTFSEAHLAAVTGEPMLVICEHPDEVIAMANLYAQIGCERPAIDDLTSRR